MKWVRLASYPTPQEAYLALSVLQGCGIESKVFNQHAAGVLPHLNQMISADLMVAEEDLKSALEALDMQSEIAEMAPERQARRYARARLVIYAGLLALLLFFGLAVTWNLFKS